MNETRRVPELDGLRGLAILQVLIWHYFISQRVSTKASAPFQITDLLSLTWSGVDLFFVLSGFLLGGILLDCRKSPNYFKTFYVRRICRIFPLYYALLLSFMLVYAFGVSNLPKVFEPLFKNPFPLWNYATFTQNYPMAFAFDFGPSWLGVTWSLAVEEQFYLMLPLLIHFVPPRILPLLLVLLIASATVLRIMVVLHQSEVILWNYIIMPQRMDSLLGGVFIAWLIRSRWAEKLRNHRACLSVACVVLFGCVLFMAIKRFGIVSFAMSKWGFFLLSAFYALLLLICVTTTEGALAKVMRTKWLCKLGIISYGVYMIHIQVNVILHGLILGRAAESKTFAGFSVTILALLTTIGLARLSYEYFEKRFIRFGHQFRY